MVESALNLIEAMHHLPTLRKLDLLACPIGSSSAPALANLIESNTTLTVMHLHESIVEDASALLLIEALRKNSTLLELCIGGSDHGGPVLEVLCDYIATNSSLECLDVSGTRIPSELRPNFEAALLKNPKMSRLYCSFGGVEIENDCDLKEEQQYPGYISSV
jgi:Ran GTPase-activating protein (RanGAP) involved in mRNA processing and transport